MAGGAEKVAGACNNSGRLLVPHDFRFRHSDRFAALAAAVSSSPQVARVLRPLNDERTCRKLGFGFGAYEGALGLLSRYESDRPWHELTTAVDNAAACAFGR